MTDVELCNLALSTVGAKALTSYDESSYQGENTRRFFPETKRRILREHVWNCAMKRQELAALTESPVFGWGNKFNLPTDCVRMVQVGPEREPFHVEGEKLMANVAPAQVLYVANVDTSYLDSHVTRCIQYLLASELANVFAKNVQLSQGLEDRLRKYILPQAKHIDGVESFGDRFFKGFQDVEHRNDEFATF